MTKNVINFPSNGKYYKNGINCRWKIRRNHPFTLKFIRFNVEPSYNCEDDFLQVGESGKRFCGRALEGRKQKFGEDEEVVLLFHSDESFTRTGFKVEVTDTDEGMNC